MSSAKIFTAVTCLIAAATTAFPHASSYVSRKDGIGYMHGNGGSIGGSYGGEYYGGYGLGGGKSDDHGDHYYHYPKYTYDYGVKDMHTGDNKKAWETRHGDVVKGGYSLKESDGTTRVVEYTADDHNGFNAIVKKIGHADHPQIYGHAGGYGGGFGGIHGGLGGQHVGILGGYAYNNIH